MFKFFLSCHKIGLLFHQCFSSRQPARQETKQNPVHQVLWVSSSWLLSVTWVGLVIGNWPLPSILQTSPSILPTCISVISAHIRLSVRVFFSSIWLQAPWERGSCLIYPCIPRPWTLYPACMVLSIYLFLKYFPDERDKGRRKKRENEVHNLWGERGGSKAPPQPPIYTLSWVLTCSREWKKLDWVTLL